MDFALPLGFLSMAIYAVRFFIMAFKNPKAYRQRYEQTYEEDNVDDELIRTSEEMFRRAEINNMTEEERGDKK